MNSLAIANTRREMPPHGATNEVYKVSPGSSDTPVERQSKSSSRMAMLQRGLSKEKLGNLKNKLQAGANNLSHKLSHHKSDDGYIDFSKRSHIDASNRSHLDASNRSHLGAQKGYSKDQVVWYKSKGKEPQQAKVLSIEMDDGHPFYTIKLLKSGSEKQTDDAHLEALGSDEVDGQARFKTDQIVFHKPCDGSPIYLTQITKVYSGDGQPLYNIRLQGSNVEKSAIKESELFDMHEVGGIASGSCPQKTARKDRARSRSPVRGIKKVLSSEGLKEMKRGVKKMGSMEGLEQMRKSLRGKSREKSRDRTVKATPVRAVPVTRSGLSSSDRSSDISKQTSSRSLRSNEGRMRGRIKKTNSLEGLREMMQGPTAGSDSSVDGSRLRRGKVKKTKSMEGMREMMQNSKNAHPPQLRRAPQPSMSMNSQHSGHRSVRSHRLPPRSSAERNQLDRERGIQRSKSLEGMHPRHFRRPSKERLAKIDHGPVRPPPGAASAAQRRASPLDASSWHGPPGGRVPQQRSGGQIPMRHGSTDSKKRGKSPRRSGGQIPMRHGSTDSKKRGKSLRSTGSLRRSLPSTPTSMAPPIRAVKKPANDDSDSEESSISSVSWQDQPRSFNRPPPPTKREVPRPIEITVDADDASSFSSEDSSWESFREKPNFRPSSTHQEGQQQKRDAEPLEVKGEPRLPPKVVGNDCVSGAELILETVYSSDEESEHPTDLSAHIEPEDLFGWAH